MNRLAKTLNVNAMVGCKIHVMSKCKIIMLTCDLNYLTCQHNDAACWYDFYLAYRGQKYATIVSMSKHDKNTVLGSYLACWHDYVARWRWHK